MSGSYVITVIWLKQCTKCKTLKPKTPEYFHIRKDTGNFRAECIECRRAYDRKRNQTEKRREWDRRRNQKPSRIAYERKRKAGSKYKEYKQEYDRKRALKPGYRKYRKTQRQGDAFQEWQRAYERSPKRIARRKTRAHRQYMREYHREWRDNTVRREKERLYSAQRRARKRNLPDTFLEKEWQNAINYFHGCCAVCGRQLNDLFGEHTAAIDHWIPIIRGGPTIAKNIIPLCHGTDGCNNSKSDRLPDEWLEWKFGKRKAKQILERIQAYFNSLD